MGWNDAYWKNKGSRRKQAAEHHQLMSQKYAKEIQKSAENTIIFDQNVDNVPEYTSNNESIVDNLDTVSAIFKYGTGDDKTIALNFASYKNPGGGFLAGSSAQEEALCMESDLYEVLSHPRLAEFYEWNNQHKNKSLYLNRGLLSPGIIFEKNGKKTTASVLTVASPNRKAYMDYINGANEEENLQALISRICFVTDIIKAQRAKVAILGAFGCGVFGQYPEVVAEIFDSRMRSSIVKNVIYAVINKGGHSEEGAFELFCQEIR